MSEIVVHSIPGSPFGRAVLVALEEKSARYRLVPVAPATLRTPGHLARHPFGRVPIMEHGDFRLYESQAILRYLDRTVPLTQLHVRLLVEPPCRRSASRHAPTGAARRVSYPSR